MVSLFLALLALLGLSQGVSASQSSGATSSLATLNGVSDDEIQIAFDQVLLPDTTGKPYTGLALGPDGKLYAGTFLGEIVRFELAADGATANPEVLDSIRLANGGERAVIGLAFDPEATAADPVLWVSHSTTGMFGGPEWSGKISRLSGPRLEVVQDYVIHLPRSLREHMTNGLAFRDGALYISQGSNTPMGDHDEEARTYIRRPERLLTAAILRLEPGLVETPPLDAKTEDGGTYDPFEPGAPLTIYASGVRNAYDLAFHTNGRLYVPVNGSAAYGRTPPSPESLPAACQRRLDGAAAGSYDGPPVPGLTRVGDQHDFLFRVEAGGYYGHPNPLRCEWVMNGGNPTDAVDSAEVAPSDSSQGYPVGTPPDRNWRPAIFSFGLHAAPTGVLEYRFDNNLKGTLLVARYSAGQDIVALRPGGPDGDILGVKTSIPGFTGLGGPVDLVEDPSNGSLYVAEFARQRITLLRPAEEIGTTALGGPPELTVSLPELVFSGTRGNTGAPSPVVLTNAGESPAIIASAELAGADQDAFLLLDPPALPLRLSPGATASFSVAFKPPRFGSLQAELRLSHGETTQEVTQVGLYGLSTTGRAGEREPSLQAVVDTLGFRINPGSPNLNLGTEPALLGDEVSAPLFRKAAERVVGIRPVARYSPNESLPFGYYFPEGDGPARTQVAAIARGQAHTLNPAVEAGGAESFEPGERAFGLYVDSKSFDRASYTQDELNSGPTAHAARVYPLKDRAGQQVPNSYLVAFEDASNGDYQDYVFVLSNVEPLTTDLASRLVLAGQPPAPWREAASAPIRRFEAQGAVVDGKLYVLGGFHTSQIEVTSRSDVYDPLTDTWTQIADLPEAVTHAGVAVDGQFIYLAGGFVGNHPGPQTDHVWRYDTSTDTWSPAPPLPAARAGGGLVRLNRTLHYFGGTTRDERGGYTSDWEDHWTLDLDAGASWTRSAAPFPNPRNHLGSVALDGRIFAIGGQHLGRQANGNQVSVHVYDPNFDAWSAAADLPIPLGHIAASTFVRDGRIVVVSGISHGGRQVETVLEYDPQTDTWRALSPLPAPREAPVAQRVGQELIVTGGRRNGPQSQTWIATLDTLDPVAGSP